MKCVKCSKNHDTGYKWCLACRERDRQYKKKSRKKRKRLAEELTVPEGQCLCKQCLKLKPIEDFQSKVNRRDTLTSNCITCRESISMSEKNPTTKRGTCRAFWEAWKKENECIDCGCKDYRVMEADHVGKKINQLSDYKYWSCNGGVEAMKSELEQCDPRCRFCHRVVTNKRSELKRESEGRTQNSTKKRRRDQINQVKLEIGNCVVCKRKVMEDTCCGFDFDHLNPTKKKIGIAISVNKSKVVFQRILKEEIPKCNLKCANCHRIKTFYE